jgi:hypothetical protein
MPGITRLGKVQLGQETTAGTKVLATALWRGTGKLEDKREIVFPDENVGFLGRITRSYSPKVGAAMTLESPATFEQILYPLNAGIKAVTSGVADGAGTGKVYTFDLPTSTQNTIKTFSVEAGDNQAVEFGQYAFTNSIVLTGKPGEAMNLTSEWILRDADYVQASSGSIGFVSTGSIVFRSAGWTDFAAGQSVNIAGSYANDGSKTIASISSGSMVLTTAPVTETSGCSITIQQGFTPSISLPAIEEIMFSKGKLYIDAIDGTIGSSLKSSTFLGMTLTINTGWLAKYTADGNLYYSFIKSGPMEVTLDITFEHDDTGEAEKSYCRAQTARKLRLLWVGSALTTAATYTYKTLNIDLAGKWEKFSVLEEEDGNNVVTGTFRGAYDSTASLFGVITVVNQLASLT